MARIDARLPRVGICRTASSQAENRYDACREGDTLPGEDAVAHAIRVQAS